nr:immunoglobulin light chain junction region [Macaca mulatta]
AYYCMIWYNNAYWVF